MNRQPIHRVRASGALTGAFFVLGLGAATAQPVPSLAPMIDKVAPSVVNISVSGTIEVGNPLTSDPFFGPFFDGPERRRTFESAGSGVIVNAAEGIVLTNHHVVENASEITVTLLDTRTARATVIGTDGASDLAVLRIDTENLSEIQFGDSDAISVGDYVVAIGNPFGFSNTVTSGIVSGLGRSGINPDRNAYEDFIQTDASINPGNSGGALVDLNGRLVGINSAIVSRTGGNIGIGFAIPVNMARNVMDQLVSFGTVSRGLLGVGIRPIDLDIAELYGLKSTAGALVRTVESDSAAEAAGLEVGDVIVTVNGAMVRDVGSLRNMIGLMRPADRVEIGYVRDGRNLSTIAVLGARPEGEASAALGAPDRGSETLFDGVELTQSESRDGVEGLLVTGVSETSPAAASGLRTGDLITRMNRQRVRTLTDARSVIEKSNVFVLQILRNGRESLLVIR
jgi:serine protease DegQ